MSERECEGCKHSFMFGNELACQQPHLIAVYKLAIRCEFGREHDNLCGPAGKLFEPREKEEGK